MNGARARAAPTHDRYHRAVSKTRSRRSSRSSSRASRLKALPWAALLQAGVAVGERWRRLSERDRARLRRLARDSRGRLGNLSSKEREELRRVVRKLDIKGMGRELLPLLRGGGRHRRRR
jgi:hypothetical protein